MEQLWFYRAGALKFGPISTDELKRRLADGRIPPDALVKCGADGPWTAAGDVPQLRPRVPPARPKTATAQPASPAKTMASPAASVAPLRLNHWRWIVCAGVAGVLVAGITVTAIGVWRARNELVLAEPEIEEVDWLKEVYEPSDESERANVTPTPEEVLKAAETEPMSGAVRDAPQNTESAPAPSTPPEPPKAPQPEAGRKPPTEPVIGPGNRVATQPQPLAAPPDDAAPDVEVREGADRQLARLDRFRRQLKKRDEDLATYRKEIDALQTHRRETTAEIASQRLRLETLRSEILKKHGGLVARTEVAVAQRRLGTFPVPAPFPPARPETLAEIMAFLEEEERVKEAAYVLEQTLAETLPRLDVIVPRERELAALPGKLLPEAIWLCDPLGRRSVESTRHVIDVSGRWIDEGDRGWLPRLVRGLARAVSGKYTSALDDLKEAQRSEERLTPVVAAARGWMLTKVGETQLASTEFDKALQTGAMPGAVEMFIAQSFVERKRYREADKHFKLAIGAQDNIVYLAQAYAFYLATRQTADGASVKQAMQQATRACEISQWDDWMALEALGTASAAAGDFELATQWTKKALERAPAECAAMLRQRLELYAAQRPLQLK